MTEFEHPGHQKLCCLTKSPGRHDRLFTRGTLLDLTILRMGEAVDHNSATLSFRFFQPVVDEQAQPTGRRIPPSSLFKVSSPVGAVGASNRSQASPTSRLPLASPDLHRGGWGQPAVIGGGPRATRNTVGFANSGGRNQNAITRCVIPHSLSCVCCQLQLSSICCSAICQHVDFCCILLNAYSTSKQQTLSIEQRSKTQGSYAHVAGAIPLITRFNSICEPCFRLPSMLILAALHYLCLFRF